jgi:hypothetical protein
MEAARVSSPPKETILKPEEQLVRTTPYVEPIPNRNSSYVEPNPNRNSSYVEHPPQQNSRISLRRQP